MSSFTGLDDVINSLSGANTASGATPPQNIFCHKDPFIGTSSVAAVAPVAGRVTSLWQYNGVPGTNGTIPPNPAATCDINTTGSMSNINAGQATGEIWLMSVGSMGLSTGTVIVYDRLAHIGGLSGTVTTAQAVSMSLTRYSSSLAAQGNQIWIEIYTQIGATAVTVTCNYKDRNGNTSVSPPTAIGGTGLREAQRWIQIPLAPGDVGVSAVNSITLSATTATAGEFGVVVAQPLAWVPISTNGTVRDLLMDLPSITKVEANACLALSFLANTTTAIQLMTNLKLLEK